MLVRLLGRGGIFESNHLFEFLRIHSLEPLAQNDFFLVFKVGLGMGSRRRLNLRLLAHRTTSLPRFHCFLLSWRCSLFLKSAFEERVIRLRLALGNFALGTLLLRAFLFLCFVFRGRTLEWTVFHWWNPVIFIVHTFLYLFQFSRLQGLITLYIFLLWHLLQSHVHYSSFSSWSFKTLWFLHLWQVWHWKDRVVIVRLSCYFWMNRDFIFFFNTILEFRVV